MNIGETLIQFINRELLSGMKEVGRTDNLLLDGMVDSIGMVRMVSFIEETYKLKIPFEDLTIENFRSVADIIAYLEKRQVGQNGKI